MWATAYTIGSSLACQGVTVVTNGNSGIGSYAPGLGAYEAGRIVTPNMDPSSYVNDIAFCSGVDSPNMPPERHIAQRLGRMLEHGDTFIALADSDSQTRAFIYLWISLMGNVWEKPRRLAIALPMISETVSPSHMTRILCQWGETWLDTLLREDMITREILGHILVSNDPDEIVSWVTESN